MFSNSCWGDKVRTYYELTRIELRIKWQLMIFFKVFNPFSPKRVRKYVRTCSPLIFNVVISSPITIVLMKIMTTGENFLASFMNDPCYKIFRHEWVIQFVEKPFLKIFLGNYFPSFFLWYRTKMQIWFDLWEELCAQKKSKQKKNFFFEIVKMRFGEWTGKKKCPSKHKKTNIRSVSLQRQ